MFAGIIHKIKDQTNKLDLNFRLLFYVETS